MKQVKNRNKCKLIESGEVCVKTRCTVCGKGYLPFRKYKEKVKKLLKPKQDKECNLEENCQCEDCKRRKATNNN